MANKKKNEKRKSAREKHENRTKNSQNSGENTEDDKLIRQLRVYLGHEIMNHNL